MWKWLEKPSSIYSLFGILWMLSIFHCNPSSLLSLSAREVLGILGIVCSSFLSSLLSCSSLFFLTPLLHTLFTSLLLMHLRCFSLLLPISTYLYPLFSCPHFSFKILKIFSLFIFYPYCFCQWLSIGLWLLFYDAGHTCTSHITTYVLPYLF